MTGRELIAQLLQLKNLDGEVWINDQQGRMAEANGPYQISENYEDITGNRIKAGDIGISFENT